MLGIPACISSLLDPVQTPSPCSHRTSYRTGAWVKIVVLSYEHWTPLEHCSLHTFSQGITVIIYFQRAILNSLFVFLVHVLVVSE